MIATPAIRNLIREDKVAQMYSAIQTGQAHGMQTLDQSLVKAYIEGLITKEEALRYADSANDVRLQIKMLDKGKMSAGGDELGLAVDEPEREGRFLGRN